MLPKIDLPIYTAKLPSNGKEVKFRPFLVREEKLLLMALESDDTDEILKTTQQVVNNCILNEDVDVEKLPFFDVDYLFIAMRAKSVGETISIRYTCQNWVGEEMCGNIFESEIDIIKCKLKKDEDIKSTIELGNSIIVKMKYPNYSMMKKSTDTPDIMEREIQVISGCIDQIVIDDNVYHAKEMSNEELVEFIEGLRQEQFSKLEHFIRNLPTFVVTAEATCTKCGHEHKLEYTDYLRFFD